MTSAATNLAPPVALPGAAPPRAAAGDAGPAWGRAAVATLAEACAPVLLFSVQLRGAQDLGDVDAARGRVRTLLARTEAGVRGLGLADADATDVMFALVATLDESIMRSPWPGRSEWVARPMQFERFGRYDGGEEFFARLDRLRQERVLRADVLHVYFFCLALGFRGWYQVRPHAEWRALVEAVAAQLRRGDPAGRPPLAPHGTAREEIAEAVREVPVWVVVVVAVATATALYLVLTALVAVRVGAVERLLAPG